MTKMQIIAKAVLSALGVYAVLTLSTNLADMLRPAYDRTSDSPVLLRVLLLAVYVCVMLVVVDRLIFRNDSIARRLAGPALLLRPDKHRLTFVVAYRLALLLVGLFLLPGAIETVFRLLWPPHLREVFTRYIESGSFLRDSVCADTWSVMIVRVIKAALAFYFVCGAPHFIQWQLNRTLSQTGPVFPEDAP